jgi:preprotein translocase subunit SecB
VSEKQYNIISMYTNEESFKFINEISWIKNKTKKLSVELNLGSITYEEINENEYLVKLSLKAKGLLKDESSEEEIYTNSVGYSGYVMIKGFEGEELDAFIKTNVASFLFPYLRTEFNRILLDTGLPKVQLQPIDWVAMYHNSKKQEVKK